MKKSALFIGLSVSWLAAVAQGQGGISQSDIDGFRAAYAATPGTKAIHNALANNAINALAPQP